MNILVIVTDQQQAATVTPGSPCRTPVLDGLAAEGVRFDRCYTPSPVCSPSRASLMTGLLPHQHGMVDVSHTVPSYRAELRAGVETWSGRLAEHGYHLGYYGKWHVERSDRLEDFGFAEHEVFLRPSPRFRAHRRALGLSEAPDLGAPSHVLRQPGYRDLTLYGVADEPVEGTTEHYVCTRAIEFLERAAGESRPWGLVVGFHGPHEPYVVPRTIFERYDPAALAPPASFDDDLSDRPAIYRRQHGVWDGMAWEQFAEATACYYALCSLIDDQVGRLLAALEATGQREETVVVFTSDHGELMGAHRLLLKGVPAFEEVYRVPLIVRGPSGAAGRVVERIVQLHDLAPTLVELGGAGRLDVHGRSLVGELRGRSDDARPHEAVAELHGQRFSYTQRVVWDDRFKYVFNAFDYDELYDLRDDPAELVNLAGRPDARPVLERLAARMWEIARETEDFSLFEAQDGTYRYVPVGPEPRRRDA
jgi:choline-sulfatase